jgi:IclR family acetate operon transcriptional repressor
MTGTGTGSTRKTTETSLLVLEAVADLEGATLTDIADYTTLATSTVHTHLRTLENAEYVTQMDDEYHLGLKLFHIGEIARHRDGRYRLAKQTAYDLANRVGEEVNFAVEEYGRSIILFDETTAPSDEGFQVGRYFHMHSSASGKAMLAEYPDDRVEAVVDRWGLPELTENTITDFGELRAEIDDIRERGYAVNRQEELNGLRAVAMAVTEPDGSVFGTLDVSGPSYRLPDPDEIVNHLRPAVRELESAIETHQ